MRAPAVTAFLAVLLLDCKEEWTNHDIHVLNPVSDKDDTDPDPTASTTGADASTAMNVEPATDAASDAAANGAAAETFVSDLAFVVVSNGYGPVEKNTSNGEMAAGDGKTITLAGVTYEKGLGVHAASEIDVPLGGQYKRFLADIGVDDEVTGGSIVFRVLADGQQIFDSGAMTGDTATKKVDVDVTGKTTLKLVVADNGDGIGQDHGDWANARLRK